jgi:hypothetical protein
MAAANNLDGSPPPAHAPPPAMKKIRKKKRAIETTAANSDRRRRPTVESLLIEAMDLLGIMLKDRQQNNSRRRKRHNTESSVDREGRRAYKIEAKKRAKIEAKATRDKQLKWSEVAITFDKADCKDTSDLSGLNPIVVQPVMCGRQVHDVLVDGGSSLNILNTHILDKMCIFPSDIEPVIHSIEGVVSGVSATSIGQIWLSVQLGTPENSRVEDVLFDVVDNLVIPFTVILGRPAIAKFMAVVHHAYQCVKIPGPNKLDQFIVMTKPSA